MSSHNKTESEILKTFIKSEACEANLQSIQDPHLFKHFDIKRQLGSGGSGAVFLAYDYQLQRDVAIKVLAPGNSFANRELLTEARIQAKIEHPHICKIYQVVEQSEQRAQSYLVMQYIRGKPATQWNESVQPNENGHRKRITNQEQIVKLMQTICDGLQALHSVEIIHRDIKPANIMLTDSKEYGFHAYLVDFGLANQNKSIDGVTEQLAIEGTLPFMSPEQLLGLPLDRRTDIYSFGVTLFQLLTGQLPFSDEDEQQLRQKIHKGTADIDIPEWQRLPIDLKAIIHKCLASKANERYQSAGQLNQELLRYLNGDPIASLPGNFYWIKKKLVKHKWQSLLVFFVGAVLIVSTIWQSYQNQQNAMREQLISQFHQSVQQARSNAQLAFMSPKHNTEYLQLTFIEIQRKILAQAEALGQIARPFSFYAQGRIAQSLGDNQLAQSLLDKAWQSGFKSMESAFALVTSLEQSYQSGLSQVHSMRQGKLRELKLEQLKNQFVTPILRYLSFIKSQPLFLAEKNQIQDGYVRYIDALVDYYNKRYDSALTKLENNQLFPAWSYRQFILAGNIYIEKYQQAALSKQPELTVHSWISKAEQAYDRALEIAPSDYNNYLSKQRLYKLVAANRQYGKGDPSAPLQSSLDLAQTAYKLNQQQPESTISFAKAIFQNAVYLDNEGLPSKDELDRSNELVSQALKQWPENTRLNSLQAVILSRYIKIDTGTGEQIEQLFVQVDRIYRCLQANHQNVDVDDLFSYALHLKRWGDFYKNQPVLAKQKYNHSIATFKEIITIEPEYSGSYVNLALIQLKLVKFDDPDKKVERLDKVTQLLQQALRRGHSEFVANFYLARTLKQQAEAIGSNDIAKANRLLDKALATLQHAETVRPDNLHLRHLRLVILSRKKEYLWYLDLPDTTIGEELTKSRLLQLEQNPGNLDNLMNAVFDVTSLVKMQQKTQTVSQEKLLLLEQLTDRLQAHELKSELLLSNYIFARLVLAKSAVKDKNKKFNKLFPLIEQLSQMPESADNHWLIGEYHKELGLNQINNGNSFDMAINQLTVAVKKENRRILYQDTLIQVYLLQYFNFYRLEPEKSQHALEKIEQVLTKSKNNSVFFDFYTTLVELVRNQNKAPEALNNYLNDAREADNFKRDVALMLLKFIF